MPSGVTTPPCDSVNDGLINGDVGRTDEGYTPEGSQEQLYGYKLEDCLNHAYFRMEEYYQFRHLWYSATWTDPVNTFPFAKFFTSTGLHRSKTKGRSASTTPSGPSKHI